MIVVPTALYGSPLYSTFRIPLSYEEDGNEKKRSINGAKNGRMETSRHSERVSFIIVNIIVWFLCFSGIRKSHEPSLINDN